MKLATTYRLEIRATIDTLSAMQRRTHIPLHLKISPKGLASLLFFTNNSTTGFFRTSSLKFWKGSLPSTQALGSPFKNVIKLDPEKMVQNFALRRNACSKQSLCTLEKFMYVCMRSTASEIERLELRKRYRFILGELDTRSGDPCQAFFPCWMNQPQRNDRTSGYQ